MNKEFTHYSLDSVIMTTMPFSKLQTMLQEFIEIHCDSVGISIATDRTDLLWQTMRDYIINLVVMCLQRFLSEVHFLLARKFFFPPRKMIDTTYLSSLGFLVIIL